MKNETAEAICQALDRLGVSHDRRDYSGRGMYGHKTTGIVIGEPEKLLAAVALAASYLPNENTRSGEFTQGDFVDDLKGVRRDNMGRDVIIY